MVTANVVDPVMQAIVGSTTASINFDLSSWAISESLAPDVDVLLQANIEAIMFMVKVLEMALTRNTRTAGSTSR